MDRTRCRCRLVLVSFVSLVITSVSTSIAESELSAREKEFIVKLHNKERRHTRPPAADMRRIEWDSDIQDQASDWVKNCQYKAPPRDLNVSANYYYKTNVNPEEFSQERFVRAAVKHWAYHKKRFNYTADCGKACPYVKMVNSLSDRIGCAINACPSNFLAQREIPFLVCFYSSAAVDGSLPYQLGLFCSGCREGFYCSDRLCIEGKPSSAELSQADELDDGDDDIDDHDDDDDNWQKHQPAGKDQASEGQSEKPTVKSDGKKSAGMSQKRWQNQVPWQGQQRWDGGSAVESEPRIQKQPRTKAQPKRGDQSDVENDPTWRTRRNYAYQLPGEVMGGPMRGSMKGPVRGPVKGPINPPTPSNPSMQNRPNPLDQSGWSYPHPPYKQYPMLNQYDGQYQHPYDSDPHLIGQYPPDGYAPSMYVPTWQSNPQPQTGRTFQPPYQRSEQRSPWLKSNFMHGGSFGHGASFGFGGSFGKGGYFGQGGYYGHRVQPFCRGGHGCNFKSYTTCNPCSFGVGQRYPVHSYKGYKGCPPMMPWPTKAGGLWYGFQGKG